MDLINLNSFLSMGYFMKYKNQEYPNNNILPKINSEKIKSTYPEIVEEGIQLYKDAINSKFDSKDKILVPISGGYDSRGILAALLEQTYANNVHTYTFGIPGTYDYEIGNQVATIAGTKHHSYNLYDYKYSLDELIDISKRIDHQTTLFHHPPIWDMDVRYKGFTIWSGVSIESWFGSHFKGQEFDNLVQEKKEFLRSNKYVKSLELMNINDTDLIEDIEFIDGYNVPKSIILDIVNRQMKKNIPHVLFKGFSYKVLFDDQPLINFAFQIPNELLIDRYIYHKILINGFPDWFDIPVKSNEGLPISSGKFRKFFKKLHNVVRFKLTGNNLNTNYLDFNHHIRNDPDFHNLIHNCIMDLKKRNIVEWIDINKIWRRHTEYGANHANALLNLASLEIHFKAGLEL